MCNDLPALTFRRKPLCSDEKYSGQRDRLERQEKQRAYTYGSNIDLNPALEYRCAEEIYDFSLCV